MPASRQRCDSSQNGTPVPLFDRRLIEIALSAMLVAAGLAGLLAEGRAAMGGDLSAPIGLSADRKLTALFQCDRAMALPALALQSAQVRAGIAARCAARAKTVLEDAPAHGFAHLVAAAASDDLQSVGDHLAASQDAAPHQGWQAERRLLRMASGSPGLRDRLAPAEIRTLLTSETGTALVLSLAQNAPGLREMMLREAKTLPAADLRRLLRLWRDGAGA